MSSLIAIAIYLPIIILLLILIGILNGTETAITSLDLFRLKTTVQTRLLTNKKTSLSKIYKLIKSFRATLMMILCACTLCNTALVSITTLFFTIIIKNETEATWITTIVIGLLILALGELTPKILAKQQPERYLNLFYPIIITLKWIFWPLTRLITWIPFTDHKEKLTITESELLTMLKIIEQSGVVEKNEQNLVSSALKFDEKTVDKVMIKFNEVDYLKIDFNFNQIRTSFLKRMHSRLPVYNPESKKFIGVINARTVLQKMLSGRLKSLKKMTSPILTFPNTLLLDDALEQFQKQQIQIAAIENFKTGQLLGIATLEDILEEIVGEIYDEYDTTGKVKQIGQHIWQIYPDVNLKLVFTKYLKIPCPLELNKIKIGQWFQKNINYNSSDLDVNENFVYENFSFRRIYIENKKNQKISIIEIEHLTSLDDELAIT